MKNRGRGFMITGALFILAAIALAGYNFYDNYKAGLNAENALAELQSAIIAEEPQEPVSPLPPEEKKEEDAPVIEAKEPAEPEPVRMIAGREYAGILTLNSFGRSLPVLNDWDYDSLKLSPCRYYGSVSDAPLVICAHNYNKHFGSLKSLKIGAAVSFEDMAGNLTDYTVVKTEILGPQDTEAMISDEYDLTLFTCTLGGATRVTVRCMKSE